MIDEDISRIVEEWKITEIGDVRWPRDIKFPIQLKSGKKFLGGIAIDITEIKRSVQKLRNAYEEIKQLVQIISPSHNMSQNMIIYILSQIICDNLN